jgi:SAM-dependent methyltransferase
MFRTYVDAGYFYEQLCRYLDVFPRKQVHVMLLDDLAGDPKATVLEVLEFLGVDREPAAHFLYPIINRSDPGIRNHLDAATLSALVEHYRPHNEKLEQLIGRSLRHWGQPFGSLARRGSF